MAEPAADRARTFALLLYPDMTLLDLVGPLHFLAAIPGSRTHLVTTGGDLEPVVADNGVAIVPNSTMRDCPLDLDVLFVPGGLNGTLAAARDGATLEFLRDRSARSRFTSSVCTGSIVLGAAGLLRGRRATSHWCAVEELARFGAIPSHERVVRDGPLITAAGVSAGLDLGAVLVRELAGPMMADALVLVSEYTVHESVSGGAPAAVGGQARTLLQPMLEDFVERVRTLATR